ncbi:transposase family protein [Streptomyces sp. NBC_00289]|uniref:transposase family protein n=1 Tax=Streptomyces sp. NBC_00289 TaxID=2975703 RepID=UPI003255F2EC
MRHRLAVVLTLTACAVLAGATSLLAVGEWIADAPGHVLEQVGANPDPLLPRRVLPAESTVRRLLARIDGDTLDGAVGRWLADRLPKATGLRGLAVDGKSLRGAAGTALRADSTGTPRPSLASHQGPAPPRSPWLETARDPWIVDVPAGPECADSPAPEPSPATLPARAAPASPAPARATAPLPPKPRSRSRRRSRQPRLPGPRPALPAQSPRSRSISAASSTSASRATSSRRSSARTRAAVSRSSSIPSTDAIAHPSLTERKQDAGCLSHSELHHV